MNNGHCAPDTARGPVMENLHGHDIADPYRWLEDPDAPEVRDWVARQQHHTEQHLASYDSRDWFRSTLAAIMHSPRGGVPIVKGQWYFCSRNDGHAPQDSWYVAESLAELESGGGRLLLDPSSWSADGTTSINTLTWTQDGARMAIAVSEAGSDWQRIRVLEVATGQWVDDVEVVTKFSNPTWLPDGESFFYQRINGDVDAVGTSTVALAARDLMVHQVGRPVADDECVWTSEGDPMLFADPEVTHDGKWVVVASSWGTERANQIDVYPITTDAGVSRLGAPVAVVGKREAEYELVCSAGDELYFRTDADAPRGRIVRCGVEPDAELSEVIAQGPGVIEWVCAAGDDLVVEHLVDVTPKLTRYGLDGTALGVVDVPGTMVVGMSGQVGKSQAFVGMSTVGQRLVAYELDVVTGSVRRLDVAAAGGFVMPEVTTRRCRATSADGTQVPYWVMSRADIVSDGPRPTMVYGYGGFAISIQPYFRAAWAGWLAAGGVLVIANLRGGSEFGRDWYDGGRRANKQNVFDDVVAVAQDLCATGIAAEQSLVINGASNGGLLVGAALTQRPELWAAAIPEVGVLDLLRFHLFTSGRAWKSDYGDPDDAADFDVVLGYSPLHNVVDGQRYPATLVVTGDHDDRVVPLHSHKFTAALQHAQGGDAPILTRIQSDAGHGAGKSADVVAAESADILAFAAQHTGLVPPS